MMTEVMSIDTGVIKYVIMLLLTKFAKNHPRCFSFRKGMKST